MKATLPPPPEPVEPVEARVSEQVAVEPPLLPAQLQLHGPLPATADAVPALQRLAVGAALADAPFALPHAPFTAGGGATAEQVAVVPPLLPTQLQIQGPLPVTAVAVPALQRFAVGALVMSAPFEEPHAPLTAPPLEAGVSVA